jgi:hypothetical protein
MIAATALDVSGQPFTASNASARAKAMNKRATVVGSRARCGTTRWVLP